MLFLTGIALFFSLKRSGIAAFSLGLVAFLYFTIKTSITQKNKFIYLIFICICLYSSLVLLQSILGERADLLSNRFTQLDDSGSGRDEIYKATWKLIGENSIMDFVIGHGYGGVLKNSPLACSAHNDYTLFYAKIRAISYWLDTKKVKLCSSCSFYICSCFDKFLLFTCFLL